MRISHINKKIFNKSDLIILMTGIGGLGILATKLMIHIYGMKLIIPRGHPRMLAHNNLGVFSMKLLTLGTAKIIYIG
jgi:hypothetical protein